MNNKKEKEREELHKTIWKIANELRGSVDGWDFKQYVLGLLFYRFISENIENYVNDNQRKAGITDFQYRNISDEEALLGKSQILDEKGFFILPSELFCNIRKGADKNENLNVVISNVFNNIEASARGTASENDVKGLFDDFTIDNKLGNTVDERNEKLVKLLNAIGDLNFGDYEDNNIDYDKESAMFTPSQKFAFNLSDMGYIVFLVEDALTCLFLSQSGMFSYNQVNTLLENKDIFNEILNNNVISFNTELNSTFNVEDKLNSIINYINKNINVRSDKKWHQKL